MWKTEYEGTDEYRLFKEITQVPRPSRHLDAIRRYIFDFAESHGLPHETDEAGNIIVRRKGTGPTMVLQGHMDMVPTCTPGTSFDFVNTPLDTYTENGWMHASGTTLGADDGCGLALMLCALSDQSLEGCDLECLFTVDEEIGLIGASKLRPGCLSGRYLINLDNEDVDEITIGSAGSSDIEATFSCDRASDDQEQFMVEVEGLRGGHSAMEIDKKRGNAILIVAGLLRKLKGVRISSFSGGSASNVIPMVASVKFSVPAYVQIDKIFDEYSRDCILTMDEPDFVMTLRKCEFDDSWNGRDSSDFLDAILTCPNGVLDSDGYGVKTSSNIGVADGDVRVVIKPRSSDFERLKGLVQEIRQVFARAGADVPETEVFPAWKEPDDGFLVRTAVSVYRDHFGRDPKVTVTHGGLESSTIKDKHPGMEAIAIGPTIHGAHTPDECLDVRTLTEMKGYLFKLIQRLKG